MRTRSVAGHSLIEMLVVLIIVGVIIAIAVPAVQRSRESARQTQCKHRQTQLAKAIHMAISKDAYGRFPGYRAFAADNTTVIGWAPQIFAYLGRSDLTETGQATYVETLVCPSDQGTKDQPHLSYVVNGGQPEIDSPADGVFYDHAKPVDQRVYITKDDFRDGLTNTIMLAENLDATLWNETDEANQCILWPLAAGNTINNGTGSRPSSHHPDGFIATFADGSAKFMVETDINNDPNVGTAASSYVALLTPGGSDWAGGGAVPGPNDPPCYDADSGFPELLDYWILTETGCSSNFHSQYTLNPDNNSHVFLIDETSTSYDLVYSDQVVGSVAHANDIGLKVTRQSDNSILIEALWQTSSGIYTIYDGDPDNGGQPIPGLIRLGGNIPCQLPWCLGNVPYNTQAQAYGSCPNTIQSVVPGSSATVPGVLCNP